MSFDVYGSLKDHAVKGQGNSLPDALDMTIAGLDVRSAYSNTGRVYWIDASFKSEAGIAWKHPVHAFILVVEGLLELNTGNGWKLVGRGEAFVVPKGVGVQLRSAGAELAMSLCRDEAEGSSTEVVHIDLAKVHPTSPPYSAELLLSGDPVQGSCPRFSCSKKHWTVGTWQSTPYKRIAVPFPKNEFMFFHIGSVEMEEREGTTHRKDRSVPFLVTKGYTIVWDSQDYIYKTSCSEVVSN